MEIKINNETQGERKRLVVWDYLRKNIDEISNGSIELNTIKVKIGLKELNKTIWQSKLDYARELANTTLASQQEIALSLINTTTATGESTEFKIIKLQTAGEQAKTLIKYEFEVAKAKILEAKKLALLNGETQVDVEVIEAEANLHLIALNLTAQKQSIILEQAINNSIIKIMNSDDGVRFCLSNGTNCANNQSTSNLTNYALKNQSETFAGNVTTTQTGFFGWLGSLTSRITTLFVGNININNTMTFEGSDSTYTIRTSNDNNTLRIFSGSDLNSAPNMKLFGINSSNNPGDFVVEAGNVSGGAIRLRTGEGEIKNRIVIQSDGDVILSDLNGTGNDYLCVASNGRIFRSNSAC